jgi:carboxypeptidase C (cathepsin A)
MVWALQGRPGPASSFVLAAFTMSDTTSSNPAGTTTPATNPAASPADQRAEKRMQALLTLPLARSSSHHRTAAGKQLNYLAEVAFLPVAEAGMAGVGAEPLAAVMCTSYVLKDAAPAKRPVCFAFNGGPGSSSIWLHLGALGPKRVVVPDDGSMPQAPYAVADNPLSWFEHFDLVFIDPPHTGWSVAGSEAARKKLFSVDGDAAALCEVVRAWLARHQRFGSPLVLAGESYGTTRGAAIADGLAGMGLPLSGLVLVSCAMDLQSIVFAPGNPLPYGLFLPAFANVAQYHGLLSGPLAASPEAARAAAEEFLPEYLHALHLGSRLSAGARTRVATRLSELTGLSRPLIEALNLRVSDADFFFEALRDSGRIVGRLDARGTGPMAAKRTREWEFDPGIEAIEGPYTLAAMDYFGRQLGVPLTERFEVLNREANQAWGWHRGSGEGRFADRMGFPTTAPDLARAMRRNPHMKVLVASGRYDLGTPYSASDWSLAQLDAPPEVLARIQHQYYDAGHMMYTRQADLAQMKADLAAWWGAPST